MLLRPRTIFAATVLVVSTVCLAFYIYHISKNHNTPDSNPITHTEVKTEQHQQENGLVEPQILQDANKVFIVFENAGMQDKPMPAIILSPDDVQPQGAAKEIIDKSPRYRLQAKLSRIARREFIKSLIERGELSKQDDNPGEYGTYAIIFATESKSWSIVRIRERAHSLLELLIRNLQTEDEDAKMILSSLLNRLQG